MDFGRLSISVRIEAPVVVNPDMDSKRASVKLGMAPERKRGRQPTKAESTQLELTSRNPSRVERLKGCLRVRIRTAEETAATPAIGMRK